MNTARPQPMFSGDRDPLKSIIEWAMEPDDPDNWQDEAEEKVDDTNAMFEGTDNERDDHESVPVVDPSYGYRFGDFMGE